MNKKNKYYIAYTIYDVELACGCSEARFHKVYDEYGNNYKRFNNRPEAEDAARKARDERGDDRWNTIECTE